MVEVEGRDVGMCVKVELLWEADTWGLAVQRVSACSLAANLRVPRPKECVHNS
jgi:hypothetical protein